MVNAYEWSYFSNYEKKNHKSPVVSAWFYRGCDNYTANSESAYGKIPGMNSPSDGWSIFHRWFPYYYGDAPVKELTGLQRTIGRIERLYDRPFIVKNNASSLRIKELNDAFPTAMFIHIERDLYYNVASLVKGLEKNKIPANKMWGTGPDKLLEGYDFLSNVEKSVFQYFFIKNYVDRLDAEGVKIVRVNYEDVIATQGEVLLSALEEHYDQPLIFRKNVERIAFLNTKKSISKELRSQIDACKDHMNEFSIRILQSAKLAKE
jgi:hypothetical protein